MLRTAAECALQENIGFVERSPPEPRVAAAEARFTASASAARDVVEALKSKEKVNCIILIGHEHTEDDMRLAREVPGIDLILGTHSHRKQDLQVVPGTHTYMISPFQYFFRKYHLRSHKK